MAAVGVEGFNIFDNYGNKVIFLLVVYDLIQMLLLVIIMLKFETHVYEDLLVIRKCLGLFIQTE